MIQAAIFDMDGTLSDCSHRSHYVNEHPKDWESFFGEMSKDPPKQNVINLAKHLQFDLSITILIVTGRPDSHYHETVEWLQKYNVPFARVFMRKKGDFESDILLKHNIYHRDILPLYDVKLVLEDRPRVVNMWRELGLECWQVAEGF